MNLDTYESGALANVFVTLPSREAACTIDAVDELGALDLRLLRGGYTLADEPGNLDFRAFVLERIAAIGYAIHGYDVAVLRARTQDPIS